MIFAFTLRWNIDSIKGDKFAEFFSIMAECEFGQDSGREVGSVCLGYDRLTSMRKHEHIKPTTCPAKLQRSL